jgi:hypothetical protein
LPGTETPFYAFARRSDGAFPNGGPIKGMQATSMARSLAVFKAAPLFEKSAMSQLPPVARGGNLFLI